MGRLWPSRNYCIATSMATIQRPADDSTPPGRASRSRHFHACVATRGLEGARRASLCPWPRANMAAPGRGTGRLGGQPSASAAKR
jgi:hypothetical protein